MVHRIARPKAARRAARRRRRQDRHRNDEVGRRARQRRLVVIVGATTVVMFGMMSCTSFAFAGMGSSPTSEPGVDRFGLLSGIPFADVFNQTAAFDIDPRLVAAVAWAESSFDPAVISCQRVSSDGAKGIMQFMPATAEELDIDPCDPAEAIPAAALYLLDLHERFQTWELALAAYNAGLGTVERFGGIPPIAETQSYVPKVMAKWADYVRQFPDTLPAPPGGSGPPGGPLGSTERYTEGRHITAKTQRLLDAVIPLFGRGRGVGCFRNGTSGEHPLGRACDFIMSSPLNTMPTPEYLEHGWAFARWLVDNAAEYDVMYVIWQKQIWSAARAGEGWRPYTRYDPNGNLQQNHFDHIHVSVNA